MRGSFLTKIIFVGVLTFGLIVAKAFAGDPLELTFREVAPGVWTGVRENSPRFPVVGTTTFVISEEGVVVYDGGGLPLVSQRVIGKIQSLTEAPVTHIIISHWHGDHNLGISKILEAYPEAEVISHSFTHAAMIGRPMDYVKGYPTRIEALSQSIKEVIEKGVDFDGTSITEADITYYEELLKYSDLLDAEFKAVRLVIPTVTFDSTLTIYSGSRVIQLMYLGDANTEGDVVMWLSEEKVIATGDIVVLPTPYAFNTDPKKWSATLAAIKALDYVTLVPGHGAIQRDTAYIDLLMESLDSIAWQVDQMIAEGLSAEEISEKLDFTAFEDRFTGGDEEITDVYNSWFTGPLRSSAYRAAMGEVMVSLIRDEEAEEPEEKAKGRD